MGIEEKLIYLISNPPIMIIEGEQYYMLFRSDGSHKLEKVTDYWERHKDNVSSTL